MFLFTDACCCLILVETPMNFLTMINLNCDINVIHPTKNVVTDTL